MIAFFKPEEEERIVESILKAERHTSGEVRVHLEDDADVPPHTFRVADAQSGEPLPESP